MARRLLDVVESQEKEQESSAGRRKHVAVSKITANDGSKDKQISAKVNERTYSLFTQINKIQGLSNNSVLNQLIFKYVRENRGILDEENQI